MTANRPFDDQHPRDRGYPDRRADPDRADREISLGTPTILGIFFFLALVCAGFFAFGYSLGRKSVQSIPPSAAASDPASTGGSNPPKPAAGSLVGHPSIAQPAYPAPASSVVVQTSPAPAAPPAAPSNTVSPSDRILAGDKLPASAPQLTTNNLQPATSYVVQVAAVSSQEVADIEIAALQKKGYAVAVRHEPQDSLLHIQIGPFATRKDADAMRARVLADGFNAIVK